MKKVMAILAAGLMVAGRCWAGSSNYVAGDFHQHTTFTDGSYSFAYQMARNYQFGLDWWANSEHGGGFNRDGRSSGTGADTLNATNYWDQSGMTILGNNLTTSGGHTNMWRWQSIRDYSFPALTNARATYPSKVIIQGYEWNVPGAKPSGAGGSGHEHCSMGTIAGEFGTNPNASIVAQFEYRFDMNDADTMGGAARGWTKSAITNTDDAKMVEAAAWLQANYGTQSWLAPAHPERKKNWTAATFRKLNDAAPDVAFGFESMPGHQRSPNRGEYGNGTNGSNNSIGGGTYGGCGYYAATVGGVWDSLLGEGRRFWLFTSSDSHEVAVNDFYPGEYQKTYTCVTNRNDPQAIVDGLRSGNGWIVEGDLIDALEFKVNGVDMGGTLTSTGGVVALSIQVHDPEGTNNGPAGHNTPTLDHVDVIAGEFGTRYTTNDTAYVSESNATARVIARFAATGGAVDSAGMTNTAWTDEGGGWKQMSLKFDTHNRKTYFRLRGSNLGVGVAGETDGAGNPLLDPLGANNTTNAFDDLWFYSNPIFVRPDSAVNFQAWQVQYFGDSANPLAASDADPDHDGANNQNEFLAGTNPTNALSVLRILSLNLKAGQWLVSWSTAGGRTNVVQISTNLINGFTDFGIPVEIGGVGDAVTNYTLFNQGVYSNLSALFYRIRLVR